MCCMQALVVSVACVVDCRRSSCRSVSLAVKGWRCQVNEKSLVQDQMHNVRVQCMCAAVLIGVPRCLPRSSVESDR